MSTTLLLLAALALISLWLMVRASLAAKKRAARAFNEQLDAQLDKMNADFDAAEREYLREERAFRREMKQEERQRKLAAQANQANQEKPVSQSPAQPLPPPAPAKPRAPCKKITPQQSSSPQTTPPLPEPAANQAPFSPPETPSRPRVFQTLWGAKIILKALLKPVLYLPRAITAFFRRPPAQAQSLPPPQSLARSYLTATHLSARSSPGATDPPPATKSRAA